MENIPSGAGGRDSWYGGVGSGLSFLASGWGKTGSKTGSSSALRFLEMEGAFVDICADGSELELVSIIVGDCEDSSGVETFSTVEDDCKIGPEFDTFSRIVDCPFVVGGLTCEDASLRSPEAWAGVIWSLSGRSAPRVESFLKIGLRNPSVPA